MKYIYSFLLVTISLACNRDFYNVNANEKFINSFDSFGNITGIWMINKKYNGTIHNGVESVIIYHSKNGILDSNYTVYKKNSNIKLEEGIFYANKTPISGDVTTIDSIKYIISQFNKNPNFIRYYRENGFPFSEEQIYGHVNTIFTMFYVDSINKFSTHYLSSKIDSTAYFGRSGILNKYKVKHDSIIIEVTYLIE